MKFELSVVPMSLFDDYQMMRKANKAALGKYLKKLNDLTLTTNSSKSPLIINGGWLLHQLSSFKGCETFDNVAQEYLKLIPKIGMFQSYLKVIEIRPKIMSIIREQRITVLI